MGVDFGLSRTRSRMQGTVFRKKMRGRIRGPSGKRIIAQREERLVSLRRGLSNTEELLRIAVVNNDRHPSEQTARLLQAAKIANEKATIQLNEAVRKISTLRKRFS